MWRSRLKPPEPDDMESAQKQEMPECPQVTPRESAWADLQRAMGFDSAKRIVEAAVALHCEPKPEEPAQAEESREQHRQSYFTCGGYAGGGSAQAEQRYLEWHRRATGGDAEAWERSAPEPNMSLDAWVTRELARAGLPHLLHETVCRLALVTMRDGVDVARRALLEERKIPESYHNAIDGILKLIPPVI